MSASAPAVTHDRALAARLGMWVFLFSDGMMFAALIATYAMLRALDPSWPDPKTRLDINLTGLFTFVLICSSVTMVLALVNAREGRLRSARGFLLLTLLGGASFLGFQSWEWGHFLHAGSGPRTDMFYGTFFVLTGFHGFHVLSGLGVLAWVLGRSRGADADAARYADTVECGALYWHFVDLVWVVIFTLLYLL
jgi:heme/copper-type cytochrome/quinol oxidase subunit 3